MGQMEGEARRSVSFVTMGCAKNEVDSQDMARLLQAGGYLIAEEPEAADVVIVNTCSFIQAATEESIEAVLETAGLESVASGRARLLVAGCMPARYGADLASALPEANRFVPCAEESSIVEIVDALFDGAGEPAGKPVFPNAVGEDAPKDDGRVSCYVKISDGCDRFCAYCTIPSIRGRYRSFTAEQVFADVGREVEAGVREIVLIAQDTGRWGADFEEPSSLAELVGSLAEQWPDIWFRIMYIQPEGVTDELIDAVAAHDNICSYFDIPFQHASGRVLRSMNRSGSSATHLELIERIRSKVPDAALRTTLIAGFPGETDDDFDELCDFVEEAQLDYVGVFPYSREEGTRAYDLPDQVDDDEKMERAQAIRDLADAISFAKIAERVGREVNVLVCGVEEDGHLFGRAQCQAPDVDGGTFLDEGEIGDIVRVRVTDTLTYEMEGVSL